MTSVRQPVLRNPAAIGSTGTLQFPSTPLPAPVRGEYMIWRKKAVDWQVDTVPFALRGTDLS
ncbi:MAG TPA: hypothetical protein VNU71_12975 [Burkholderiaceae bacterium]|nr:hypothetical protein [Burkholderiaceae bacterium]